MLAQLTELREMIMGDLREGGREGLKAFRAALRRVFVAFALIEPYTPERGFSLGAAEIGGVIWPQNRDVVAGGYVPVPHVRPQALNLDAERVGSYAIDLRS